MKNIILFILIILSSTLCFSQSLKLKNDSLFVKNFQIEFLGEKNYLFVSHDGSAEIPFQNFRQFSKVNIIDLERNVLYDLYAEELKIKDNVLHFSSGKLIEPIAMDKRKEMIIGIEEKGGGSYRLYMIPDIIRIDEIPVLKSYENKKIKKIRYYFSAGKHPQYNIKTEKEMIKIIPILYSCDSIDCKDPKTLIPEMEVGFTENEKYLEVDLRNKNIVIDENSKNIYVGFETLGYYVTKMKKAKKLGDSKCYAAAGEPLRYKQTTHSCPVISLIIE